MKQCEVLVAQLYLSIYNPMDCSPPGSSVHGILQVRILEWVAVPFSRGSSWPRDWTRISHIAARFLTIWATREAPEIVEHLKINGAMTYGIFKNIQSLTVSSHLYCSLLGKVFIIFCLHYCSSLLTYSTFTLCYLSIHSQHLYQNVPVKTESYTSL